MLGCLPAVFALLCQLVAPVAAEDAPRSSECLAVANAAPRATPVSLRAAAAKSDEIAITYAGDSTYYIDTSGGVQRFMTPLDEFIRRIGQQFAIDERSERTPTISRQPLPDTPTVIVLRGV